MNTNSVTAAAYKDPFFIDSGASMGAATQAAVQEGEASREEKPKKSYKVVSREKRDQCAQFAQAQIEKLFPQDDTAIARILGMMPIVESKMSAANAEVSQKLTAEQNAVAQWIGKLATHKQAEKHQGMMPKFIAVIPDVSKEKYEHWVELSVVEVVLPKAAELCRDVQGISTDFVENLVNDAME
jgi:hypothetical protein